MSAVVVARLHERPVIAGRPPCPQDDPSCDALRDRVLEIVRSAAANPHLTIGDVAAEIGITERTLLRAFERESRSVAGHLAQARLDLALTHLGSPRQRHLDLAAVAARSGYASVADLERAVLTATGLTPAQYRDGTDGRPSPSPHWPSRATTQPGQRARDPLSLLP